MRKVLISTAVIMGSGLTSASAEVIVDYRDDAFLSGSPFYSQAERSVVAAALKKAPSKIADRFGDKFVIRGDATGAFTEAGAQERVFLVQEKAAVAAKPFPDESAPLLLVMRARHPIGFYSLAGDIQYQRLVASADVNGDSLDEVFLETSTMNMGELLVSVDVASMDKDGAAKVIETINVYSDSCERPSGKKERTASAISLEKGLTSKSFEEPCPQ